MCDGRVQVIQGIQEPHLKYCPDCGLDVKRVISRASINLKPSFDPTRASKNGFTTWRRLEEGKWEKVDGSGVDMIVADPRDAAQVKAKKEAETTKAKVIDLDKSP